MTTKTYIVRVPHRGHASYLVDASSGAEAERVLEAWRDDGACEVMVDNELVIAERRVRHLTTEVDWAGKARAVGLDEAHPRAIASGKDG